MSPEVLQVIGGVVATAATMGLVTWRWLNRITAALDAVPGLVKDNAKVADTVRAAHRRLDEHIHDSNQRFERHGERLTVMETLWKNHDREQERRDAEMKRWMDAFSQKLDRVDEKLDRVLEKGQP